MKWTRRILIGLLILATLITALWWEENWRGQKIWEESCARLRAAGEPVQIADIIPPMIPDEENVAAAPIFAELSRLGAWGERWVKGEPYPKSRPMSRSDLSQVSHWAEFLRNHHPTLVPVRPFTNPADEVMHFYSHWSGPWQEIRSALARPRCRWPVEYEKAEAMGFPHLFALQLVCLNARGWMISHAAKGDSDAFYDMLTTLLRLERIVTQEPTFLIGHLVGNDILRNALLTWQNCLPLLAFTEDQLAHLQNQLAKIDLREFQACLRDEAALFMETSRGMTNAEMASYLIEMDAISWKWGGKAEGFEKSAFKIAMTVRPEGWRLADLADLQHGLHDLNAHGWGERDNFSSKEYLKDLELRVQGTVSRLGWYSFSRHILAEQHSTYESYLSRTSEINGLVRSAVLWCACERFRLKYGRVPHNPQELVPDFLKDIPNDPVGGEPLRYEVREGGKLLIYSLGSDGVDNGGVRGIGSRGGDWGWSSDPMLLVSPRELKEWKEEDEERQRAAQP